MTASAARPRRPAGQTRALMLAVALERVQAEGLLLDFANIELEDLIRAADVPRSTVFRIWPDRVAFVADLVRALFEADAGFNTGFDDETLRLLADLVARIGADLTTPAGREIGLRTAVRLAVDHNISAVDRSVAWRAYRAMSAALAGGDAVPGGAEIRALLTQIEHQYVDRMAPIYRELNASFGLRMRDGVTERDLALAIVAIVDGMSDHRRIDPAVMDAPRVVSLGIEGPQEWHLAGLAVYGIYATLTEPARSFRGAMGTERGVGVSSPAGSDSG